MRHAYAMQPAKLDRTDVDTRWLAVCAVTCAIRYDIIMIAADDFLICNVKVISSP